MWGKLFIMIFLTSRKQMNIYIAENAMCILLAVAIVGI